MGLFDSIRGAFNPETIAIYNDLINNHKEAFRRWRGKQIVGTLSEYFDFRPTFADKQYIANHRADILAYEAIIAEERAYNARRQEVINASVKYPTAFRALVKKLGLPVIPDLTATLPGERKSKRTIRLQKEAQKNRQPSAFSHINVNTFQNLLSNSQPSKTTPQRSIQTLKKVEYERLYSQLCSLPTDETRLKNELSKEDLIFFFEDNILDNDRRKSFYKLFLAKNNRKDTDYQFLSNHIYELDNYIKIEIQSQYDALVRAFPLGIQELHSSKPYGESDLDFKERIINDKETVERLDKVKRKFDELKRKYPVGLPAFQKFNSFDDGKNSAELSLEEVIEHEDEIAKFERYADEHSKFLNWQREQKEFASISRNLCPENYGCYFYDVPLSGINADGSATTSEYRVWQHFYTSFYDTIPGTTISDDFAYLSKRAAENSKFLNGGWNYKDSVYNDILGLIKAFKDKVGDISIVFASNGLDSTESFVFNHSKFEYLISKLDESDILYYEGDADLFQDDIELTKHILIFEFVSTNSRLIQTVEQIRKQFTSRQPLISYISLRKGYDFLEIEQLATQKEQERKAQKAKEEAEKKRLQEEKERKQREEETKRKERQRKRQEIQELHACVQDWHLTRYGIRYNYIYEYLKTTAPRNATESEWDIRHLIWAFKNDPNKSDRDYSYSEALDIIVPRYESVLKRTFSANTSKLTFACLPASTSNKNRLRWYEFSKRVCADLNMINAYVEKARAFDPFGHAGLTPLGEIRMTLAGEIKMTPVEVSAGEFFVALRLLVLARRGSISKTTEYDCKIKKHPSMLRSRNGNKRDGQHVSPFPQYRTQVCPAVHFKRQDYRTAA